MKLGRSSVAWAMLLAVAGCSRTQAAPATMPPPPQVSVAKVVVRKVQDWQDFTGRLEAVNSVDLRPRVSGHIEAVRFVEGARVKKDQVLFQIDARTFREEVNRLSAELRRNESQLALARTNLQRGKRLLEEGATPAGEIDQLSAAEASAAASLDGIRAALAQARLNLEFTNVRSPIAGRVSNARITSGNLVSSADVLTRVVSDDPIYTYFDVDEGGFLALAREQASGKGAVQMGLSSETGYPHAGKLDFVDNQVDPRTGTIRARAVFDNHEQRFTPGLFARVRLLTAREFEAMLIDEKALLTDQNRKYVFVVDQSKRAQRKDVKLGRSVDGMRIVSEGLSPEDRVIVQGTQKVFAPGMPVQAEEVAAAK
ncbi:MAG TPA: efflux RND transporter periplasmic adaptor subunit [Polyangiales bacterium]|nr:efflux RND transporter periplasmic adaptor subunit [Polyangiales bacterium]